MTDPARDARWRACFWLSTSVLLSMSTWLTSSVVSNHLQSKYDVSGAVVGVLSASVQAGFVISSLIQTFTMLPDRAGCRMLMGMGGIVAALINPAFYWAPTFGVAVCCRLATGACMALVYPPSTKVGSGCVGSDIQCHWCEPRMMRDAGACDMVCCQPSDCDGHIGRLNLAR